MIHRLAYIRDGGALICVQGILSEFVRIIIIEILDHLELGFTALPEKAHSFCRWGIPTKSYLWDFAAFSTQYGAQ